MSVLQYMQTYAIALVPYHSNAPFHHFAYGEHLRKGRIKGRKARHCLSSERMNTATFNRSVQIE
jgi:hypothetical protein